MARGGAAPLPTITDDRALGDAKIQRSLRFDDGDSAYLSRTPSSAGDRRTFTISIWAKRGNTGSGAMFGSWISDSDRATFRFSSDYIEFQDSGSSASVKTNAVFRDVANWYHVVAAIDTTQGTQSNRGKIYVNGVQQSLSSNNFTQNVQTSVNNNSVQVFGTRWISGPNSNFDGYLAEINLIDGQQLDASYFGFTDSQTGIWMPKRYEGTYGTNGVRLDFSDNSSASTLAIDKSPNGNDFASTNVAVSDSVIDTPSNNFCTLNSVNKDSNTTLSEGNLKAAGSSSTAYSNHTHGTIAKSSGKWYYEVEYTSNAGGHNSNLPAIGWVRTSLDPSDNPTVSGGLCYRPANADYIDLDGNDTSDDKPQTSTGNVIQVAIDLDAGKIWFGNGGTYFESGNPSTGANANLTFTGGAEELTPFVRSLSSTFNFNFGQRAFSYTPPTGFNKLSSSDSIPTSPSITKPQRHFDTILYTGDGQNNRKITGLEFKPGLVWLKQRAQSGGGEIDGNHGWYDSVRGVTKRLKSNSSGAEDTFAIGSFDDGGFTFATETYYNDNNDTFVGWFWKAGDATVTNNDGSITSSVSANTEAGFSIVTWTGTGSDGTIGHGLGKVPSLYIVKRRNSSKDWYVQIGNITGFDLGRFLKLNAINGINFASDVFAASADTSTVLNTKGDTATNGSGDTYIAYCWTSIPGYSKFGSYKGNGNADGSYVELGFRPAWLMIKNTATGTWWFIYDVKRETYNPMYNIFGSNVADAEYYDNAYKIDILSNGFKARGTQPEINKDGDTIIYMAFAEQPGTTSFGTVANAR